MLKKISLILILISGLLTCQGCMTIEINYKISEEETIQIKRKFGLNNFDAVKGETIIIKSKNNQTNNII